MVDYCSRCICLSHYTVIIQYITVTVTRLSGFQALQKSIESHLFISISHNISFVSFESLFSLSSLVTSSYVSQGHLSPLISLLSSLYIIFSLLQPLWQPIRPSNSLLIEIAQQESSLESSCSVSSIRVVQKPNRFLTMDNQNQAYFENLDREFINISRITDDTFVYKGADVLVQSTWELPIIIQWPESTVNFEFSTTQGEAVLLT
jgi:hypothetical protein